MINKWYIPTNLIAWGIIAILFIHVLIFSKEKWKQFTTKKIVLVAKLTAIAAALSLVSNYIRIPGLESVRFKWGDWIIFLEGLLFGPLVGMTGAICYDVVQNIIGNLGGQYHGGFQLDFVLYGFVGGLIKVFFQNSDYKYLIAFIAYALVYSLISLLLNPIWLWTIGWSKAIFINVMVRVAKLGPCIALYGTSLIITYKIMSKIVINNV